jgi:hypothetical protein
MIALGGGLAAQSGAPTSPDQSTQTDQRAPVDPVTGALNSQTGAPPAPDPKAVPPGEAKFTGKVGPGGSVVGSRQSPQGSKKLDPAIERLGPDGVALKASSLERLGPGASLDPAAASQLAAPDAKSSQPSGNAPATKPAAKKPAAKAGTMVFIDPTGSVIEPTDDQLLQMQAGSVAFDAAQAVERPGQVAGGMDADVPGGLFPVATAAIGTDGKVSIGERQAQADERMGLSRRRSKPLQSLVAQRPGPGGDMVAAVPTSGADVTIAIVNGDAAGEGFNDNTAVAPVFGNRGTTRGQQRLNAFRAAAEHWGRILRSNITIRVDAEMNPQACTATSAILGSAGPNTVHRDFAGAPVAATWYVQAVANSRFGADLDAQADISAQFNSDVDNATCLGSTNWWYGIGAPAPSGSIDFYTVVLHEIGHGIGVLSLVSTGSGAKFLGFDDAYIRWLWDWNLGGWPALSNAGRLASQVNTGQVIFWGPNATEASRGLQNVGNNGNYPRVYAPNPVQPGSSTSHFDTVHSPNELMEPAITAPPGPYAYLTSGLLQDVGWRLLSNGVFDYNASGTWTWNPTDGWFQPTAVNPALLEGWNGNFVGVYNGTWLWNETTGGWAQLTTANPTILRGCGNNLLWSSSAYGTWRWNTSTGWDQLSNLAPQSMVCFGDEMVWQGSVGTWLYDFVAGGGPGVGGWSLITSVDPNGIMACGRKLIWWRNAGAIVDTWAWDNGWTFLTGVGPETAACYRNMLAWEGAAGPGTWLYNFNTAGWTQITGANPDQMVAWGPNLAWDGGAAFGTWTYSTDTGWAQITGANPTLIEVLADHLFWSWPGETWVWSGGGVGTAWTRITTISPTQIVSTGAVHPSR